MRSFSGWPIYAVAAILLIALAILSRWTDERLVEQARSEIGRELNAVLNTTTLALDHWFQSFEGVIEVWGTDEGTYELTQDLLGLSTDEEALRGSPLQELFRLHLRPVLAIRGIRGYGVYSENGTVVSSSRESDIGRRESNSEIRALLTRALQPDSGVIIGLPLKSHGKDFATMIGAKAIRDESGAAVAVLSFRVNPESEFTEILQRGRMGESGESYAFNSEGKMISDSRFGDDLEALALVPDMGVSILTVDIRDPGGNLLEGYHPKLQREKQPLTLMAQSAINGNKDQNLIGYNDYRGVPVIGAWRWNDKYGYGATTEIDVDEAYKSLSVTRKLFYSLVLFSALLIIALSMFFVRSRARIAETLTELHKSTEQTNLVLDNATDGILTIDDAQHIVRFNPACESIWGYSAKEVIGKEITMLIPEYAREGHLANVHRFRDSKIGGVHIEDRGLNLYGLTKDGVVFPAEVGISMSEFDGTVHYSAFIKDITLRKQAEEDLLAAKQAVDDALSELENVRSVILRWTPEQAIRSINAYGLELFGYSEEQLVGKSLIGTIVQDTEATHEGIADLVKNIVLNPGQYAGLEGQNCTRDGEELWMSWSNNPILDEDGSLKEVLAIGHDITERKKLEADLKAARDVANEATKAKGDFLANMSHEIRTPMNAVIGLSELCLRTDLTVKQRDYLSKIHGSAESLLGIINDILDFSKIEAGRLDIEDIEFEIDQVLDNLATVAQVKTQEKGLEFLFKRDPQVPTVLVGDPLRLGQILINLTNNAIKFTDKGEILVDIELLETVDERVTVRFSVHDTGIGMTEEQMGKLFQSFSQADTSTTRKYGGTGLGLSISKQLVELMGGEIGVQSKPEVGSTFAFTVVLGVGANAKEKLFTVVPDLQNKHALVVDDNATAREILSTYLESFTFTVDEARNADEMFDLIGETGNGYELIILDWLMPGMKGTEAARKIKTEIRPDIDPHIIMVSAFSSGDVTGKPGGEYIDQFLSKPVSPSHLFDAIMIAFGVASDERKRAASSNDFDLESLRTVQGAQILLVEDNEINQQVASEVLEQAGFFVDIACHGQEALDMLEQKTYDCVLMDVQMPVMDGFTATGKIRQDERFSELPVLAMTANATLEDRDRSLAAGMNEHIAKPIRPHILFAALLKWIPHGDRELPETLQTESPQQETVSLPPMPGIDTDDGLSRFGGNAQSYIKLMHKFAENQADATSDIAAAVEADDKELAIRLAHTLKGVSGNIGATDLQELALKLESALNEDQQEQISPLLADTGAELERVISLISGLEEEQATQGDTGPASLPDDLPQRLELLLTRLEDYDSSAEDVLLDILHLIPGTELHTKLQDIKKQITQYDLEGAAEALRPVIEHYGEPGNPDE